MEWGFILKLLVASSAKVNWNKCGAFMSVLNCQLDYFHRCMAWLKNFRIVLKKNKLGELVVCRYGLRMQEAN